jgi:hypothetical protein
MFKKNKRQDKYSQWNDDTMFGFLINALDGGIENDNGDKGQAYPRSDAEDFSRGLRFVPGEVTEARRRGERIPFVDQHCGNPCCWYWQFPDGGRTYYWQRDEFEFVASVNGKTKSENGDYPDDIGPCPSCGNPHMIGGHIKREDIGKLA